MATGKIKIAEEIRLQGMEYIARFYNETLQSTLGKKDDEGEVVEIRPLSIENMWRLNDADLAFLRASALAYEKLKKLGAPYRQRSEQELENEQGLYDFLGYKKPIKTANEYLADVKELRTQIEYRIETNDDTAYRVGKIYAENILWEYQSLLKTLKKMEKALSE